MTFKSPKAAKKVDVVIHGFPSIAEGRLPCCGLHRLEVRQTDRATIEADKVTCTGVKRYRTDLPRRR